MSRLKFWQPTISIDDYYQYPITIFRCTPPWYSKFWQLTIFEGDGQYPTMTICNYRSKRVSMILYDHLYRWWMLTKNKNKIKYKNITTIPEKKKHESGSKECPPTGQLWRYTWNFRITWTKSFIRRSRIKVLNSDRKRSLPHGGEKNWDLQLDMQRTCSSYHRAASGGWRSRTSNATKGTEWRRMFEI